jgi:hypothetical protein
VHQAKRDESLRGIKVCPRAPSVSHLLFADNSLILCWAKEGDAHKLQDILNLYEECSGEMINKEKAAIMFTANTGEADRAKMMQTLQIQKTAMNDKYLGMPIHVGQCRTKVFAYLKERVWNRI